MRKIPFLLVGLLFLFGGKVLAQTPIPQSGINWNLSTMTVNFIPELDPGTPPFSCFGQTPTPPDPNTATENLANLGFSDSTPQGNITNCFQQAGDYDVTVVLVDNAGNTMDPPIDYAFTIRASDPDSGTSTFEPFDATCITRVPFANDIDSCDLVVTIRDQFGNPVTQLTDGKFYISSASTEFDLTEANEGDVNFLNGLKYADLPLPFSPPVADNVNGISGGAITLPLKAIAPSIRVINDSDGVPLLAEVIDREVDLSIQVPGIDSAGNLDPASPVIVTNADVPLRFNNLFSIMPTSEDGLFWNTPGIITTNLGGSPTALEDTARLGTLQNKEDLYTYRDEPLPEPEVGFNPFTGSAGINYINYDVEDFNDWTTTPLFEIGSEDETITGELTLPLQTRVQYDIGSDTIQYIAGGAGLEGAYGAIPIPGDPIGYNTEGVIARFVGADIEGGILGDLARMKFQSAGEFSTFHVSEVTAKDIREQITSNARRLSRGASNVVTSSTNFSSLNFDNTDVIVVRNANITMDVATLPEGKNTLLIESGNLIIEQSFDYVDKANDSFGFILSNDTPASYPTTGNIFIRSDVREMVGSYYADGGLMTNDDANPTTTISEGNGNTEGTGEDDHIVQLLLRGTLFTKNTLGGSIIKQDPSGHFFTPWSDSEPDQERARQYDLHFVRRYIKEIQIPNEDYPPVLPMTFTQVNTDNCAPAAGACDANENAFVIRVDRKVSELPPPGFEIQDTIVR